MSWTDKIKEWGGGDVSFLSEDGEIISFVIVGEPVLLEGKFQGQQTLRVGCPIVSLDGFSLLIVGKRVARRLSKYEKHFGNRAFELIRHGEPGDTKSRYELTYCQDKELEKQLLTMAGAKDWSVELTEAIESASEIVSG